jgi:uncharacterized repeat protein (TIGR01451 family)
MFSHFKNSVKLISLLILLALGFAAVFAPKSTGESLRWPNLPHSETPEPRRNEFGKLPLSFELNQGQTDSSVKFLARGHGYTIFLTGNEAVLSFSETKTFLHMRLQDVATSPRITGVEQLPGKVNYLLGSKSTDWRTDIPTYARVRYEQVYRGVDLVYYGNQRQLEYDFIAQPGANTRQIRLAFDGTAKPTLNRRGELILKSGEHKLTLLRPRAYQKIDNQRREVSARYSLNRRGEVAFQLGNYDKSQPLVIDPLLVYSTFLGGSGLDFGNSIAVDSSGNAYIAGQTESLNFPTSAPLQSTNGGGSDAFVAKLNAAGSALIYSTFIGGTDDDTAASVAIDNAGHAYITGQTFSTNFPVHTALHPTLSGSADAFVAKLNSAGSALVYSTYLGGHGTELGNSIAVDSAGNAYVTGTTPSTDFPTTNPLQPNRLGHAIFKSTNGAGNWAGSDSGLAAAIVFDLAFAPNNSSIMYAAAETGLFKTTDGGANWNLVPSTPPFAINKLAIDQINPAIIYAAATGGMFNSTDSGNTFTAINNGFIGNGRAVLIDPVTPTTLYATSFGNRVFKSVDAGATWTFVFIEDANIIHGLEIEPNTPATLYAATNRGLFKSTNSGVNWTALDFGLNFNATANGVAIDKTSGAVYAATITGLLKSVNGGTSWTNLSGTLNVVVNSITIDPTNSSILYVTTIDGPSKSIDGGVTWTVSNTGYSNIQVLSLVINPAQPATLFIGTASGSDAFVTKLSAGGASQVYSTYLGGSLFDSGLGVALDATGNAYVTGSAVSSDFPTANAIQPVTGGGGDAFITKLNPNGSALVYSTFLGGEGADSAAAIAVDASGNAYIAGSTNSLAFPIVNAFQPVNPSFSGDGFVAKVNAAGSAVVYGTYLGGHGVDDCVGIAVDTAGSAYVTGNTHSTDFPTVAPLQSLASEFRSDAFVTKFAPDGKTLIYSTYLGGTESDGGSGIAVDSSKNVYVVGDTDSADFPTKNPLQPVIGGSSDVFVVKLNPAPDLEVTVNDTPHLVNFGNNLTYTITVKNTGGLAATGVTLADNIPTGASLVSANSNAGTCSGTTSINCGIGTLNGGATATVTIVVTPPAVSFIHNTATATLNEVDAAPTNNAVTTESIVIFADVSLTEKAAQNLVAPGGTLTFSLIVKNKGGVPINVSITDQLPDGMTLVKCTATGNGVCGGTANLVGVDFPQIAATAMETILLTIRVSPSATEGTVITNTAIVTSPVPDPDFSNNTATASVTVAAVPILQKSNGIIAFQREFFPPGPEPSGIYTVKPDITDEKLFPNIPVNSRAGTPEWSPDGSRLAFQIFHSSGSNEINVINADATGLLKLVDDVSQHNRGITWSPNGSQIAYIGSGGPSEDTLETIHIANVDGSGSYRLPGSPTSLWAVDWSPDGTKFVYSNAEELFVINIDGTGKQQLTTVQQTLTGNTADFDPRWSPDGTKILFQRYASSIAATTYLMNADGSNQRKLFNFDSYTPHWSPDGLSVAMMVPSGMICTVNLDNTNLKCPTVLTFSDSSPSWQRLPNPNPTPTPTPAPTFLISGKVTSSTPFVFAAVELNGPLSASLINDANGNYEFVNLPAGQYTLTPVNIGYDWVPASRTVTITNANITGQDFAGTLATVNISGHVKDKNGNPLAAIKITVGSPGAIGFIVSTDVSGFYSLPVQRGGHYNVVIDPVTPYEFVPPSKFFTNLVTDEIVDFIGTRQSTKVIAGRVVEVNNGPGVEGIRVVLSQDDTGSTQTFTDADGNFSFGDRKINHRYDLLVPDVPLYLFQPRVSFPGGDEARIVIPTLTSDEYVTFTATRRNTVQFTAASAQVNEGSGFREIVVTRVGDVTSAASVNFATADTAGLAVCSVVNGKASERCDYGSTAGTLRFVAGEASKSILVPIIDDVHVEGDETFTIALSAPVGTQTDSNASITVTITDNDTTPATQNPIDGINFFVTQQYVDFLGRLPDGLGFQNWVQTLIACPDNGFGENRNPFCDRVHVSSGFFLSDEFRGRGYWAYRFYEVAYDRKPLYAEFVPDLAQVGGAQSPESEVLSKAAYSDAFVLRHEFLIRYTGSTNAAYVNALEQNAEITLTNKADLIAALDNNQKSRGQVLRDIVESKAVEDRFFIRAFVAMQYFGYLRRDPDTVGYNNWVTTLTNDPSNFRHMIFGFLFSTEYRGRFGS